MQASTWRWLALVAALLALTRPVATQEQAYNIGSHDVLAVSVFNQPQLTGSFEVGSDGAVAFPLVGRVKAAGLTLREFEASLVKALSENILRRPEVSVTVETYRSQQFFVIGEVRQPGAYVLSGRETVVQAIARAGYTTPEAGDDVLVVRPGQTANTRGPLQPDQVDAKDVLRVNLADLTSGASPDTPVVQHGDTIIVGRAEQVFILGQVKTPGAYRLTRGLTVVQLISMAGGLTDRGTQRRMKVTRMVNGRKQESKISLNDPVLANDTITVAERWF
ncbi:MAG: SLBB domain-containing protein [Acidobacteria bacterium]|nr:SLBB domain-containing protein [Acidobacteriota bacterium]